MEKPKKYKTCSTCRFAILTNQGWMCRRLIRDKGYKNPAGIISTMNTELINAVKISLMDWCNGWMKK